MKMKWLPEEDADCVQMLPGCKQRSRNTCLEGSGSQALTPGSAVGRITHPEQHHDNKQCVNISFTMSSINVNDLKYLRDFCIYMLSARYIIGNEAMMAL